MRALSTTLATAQKEQRRQVDIDEGTYSETITAEVIYPCLGLNASISTGQGLNCTFVLQGIPLGVYYNQIFFESIMPIPLPYSEKSMLKKSCSLKSKSAICR